MKLFRNYFFWAYERGSFHYDVMVTLILLFIFVSPHYINFKDKPVPTIPLHSSEVLVKEAGMVGTDTRLVYEIRAEDLGGAKTDTDIRAAILRVVEPLSGYVVLQSYKPINDATGKLVAYDATVLR